MCKHEVWLRIFATTGLAEHRMTRLHPRLSLAHPDMTTASHIDELRWCVVCGSLQSLRAGEAPSEWIECRAYALAAKTEGA